MDRAGWAETVAEDNNERTTVHYIINGFEENVAWDKLRATLIGIPYEMGRRTINAIKQMRLEQSRDQRQHSHKWGLVATEQF